MKLENLIIAVLVCLLILGILGFFLPKIQDPKRTGKVIVLFFDDGWENQYTVAYPILKIHGFQATFGIITGHISEPYDSERVYMTEKQIRELHLDGMEIASHSHSHSLIINLSESDLRMELRESKKYLKKC